MITAILWLQGDLVIDGPYEKRGYQRNAVERLEIRDERVLVGPTGVSIYHDNDTVTTFPWWRVLRVDEQT